ncbi:hypothetical protein [Actinomyces succiniciruminis]|uniref:Uncharacterized protein n=1 Tax=Actinomyces succiniciruminis TaxID=1522002 RepID=A0A1L7R9R6_9ACTO|nr:hypothetical protein [Actinomyces succiniciruminis]CED90605.1 Hypothetical protein AAM4_0773 [Actinomyces succiniciruminis]
MTDTIAIRPIAAVELEPGMHVRHQGESREIRLVDIDTGVYVVVQFADGDGIAYPAETMVDVVVPEPAQEPAWPTSPAIRILDGHQDHRDIGGMVALRSSMYAYHLFSGGSDAGYIFRDSADDEIETWEDLSVVPTEAVRTLSRRLSELDIASPLSRDAAIARVVDAAESLALVADSGEED